MQQDALKIGEVAARTAGLRDLERQVLGVRGLCTQVQTAKDCAILQCLGKH